MKDSMTDELGFSKKISLLSDKDCSLFSSLIEDDFFMNLDNISAKTIITLQKEKNNKELLNVDNLALLDFFIINLQLRRKSGSGK